MVQYYGPSDVSAFPSRYGLPMRYDPDGNNHTVAALQAYLYLQDMGYQNSLRLAPSHLTLLSSIQEFDFFVQQHCNVHVCYCVPWVANCQLYGPYWEALVRQIKGEERTKNDSLAVPFATVDCGVTPDLCYREQVYRVIDFWRVEREPDLPFYQTIVRGAIFDDVDEDSVEMVEVYKALHDYFQSCHSICNGKTTTKMEKNGSTKCCTKTHSKAWYWRCTRTVASC